MSDSPEPLLSTDGLIALARSWRPTAGCAVCDSLVCPGWESLSAGFDRAGLRRVGTLRPDHDHYIDGDDTEPTLQEHHPAGTHGWSVDAPIAPAFFPYNRCDVWLCVACARPFLRYTEYGGYYTDERIRELRAELVSDALPPAP